MNARFHAGNRAGGANGTVYIDGNTDTVGGRPEELSPENRINVQSHYKAHVKLKSQTLVAQGEKFALRAGMQVVAEIHLGERTIMEYLLSPVQKAVGEAGRER